MWVFFLYEAIKIVYSNSDNKQQRWSTGEGDEVLGMWWVKALFPMALFTEIHNMWWFIWRAMMLGLQMASFEGNVGSLKQTMDDFSLPGYKVLTVLTGKQ